MKLYHVSLAREVIHNFTPLIPANIQDNENTTQPRICLAPTLEGCLTSIIQKEKSMHTKLKGTILNVYLFDVDKLGRLVGSMDLSEQGYVSDAYLTNEYWCLDPIAVQKDDVRKIQIVGLRTKTVVYITLKERHFWFSKHNDYLKQFITMLPREEFLKLTDFEEFLKYMKKQGAIKAKLYRVVTEVKYKEVIN